MSVPGAINTPVDGVPLRRSPVHWDLRLPVEVNLNVIDRWIGYYADLLPEGCAIDEAAIMVPGLYQEGLLGKKLLETGWEWFNSAEDLVFTNPFGTRYFVSYSFYRSSARPYRLEIMHMTEGRIDGEPGFSPLHEALWANGKKPVSPEVFDLPIPHLSFKPVLPKHAEVLEGEELALQKDRSYGRAVQTLQDNACIHAQTCQSTYGRFGYFLHNAATRQVYVKPRVNLRDDA